MVGISKTNHTKLKKYRLSYNYTARNSKVIRSASRIVLAHNKDEAKHKIADFHMYPVRPTAVKVVRMW